MIKIVLDVEGMACGMCESHVNDAIRKNFKVKKVSSYHSKGKTEIVAETALDTDKLKAVVEGLGYTVRAINAETYEKKAFSFFRK